MVMACPLLPEAQALFWCVDRHPHFRFRCLLRRKAKIGFLFFYFFKQAGCGVVRRGGDRWSPGSKSARHHFRTGWRRAAAQRFDGDRRGLIIRKRTRRGYLHHPVAQGRRREGTAIILGTVADQPELKLLGGRDGRQVAGHEDTMQRIMANDEGAVGMRGERRSPHFEDGER